MSKDFKKDIFRYYGKEKETLKEKLLRPNGLKYMKYFRKCSNSHNKILKTIYKIKLKLLSKKLLYRYMIVQILEMAFILDIME